MTIRWEELGEEAKQDCRKLVSKYTKSQSDHAQGGIGMQYGQLEPDEVTKDALEDLLYPALDYYNKSLSNIAFRRTTMTLEQRKRLAKHAEEWFERNLDFDPKPWMIRWIKDEVELTAFTPIDLTFSKDDVILASKRLVRNLIDHANECKAENVIEH